MPIEDLHMKGELFLYLKSLSFQEFIAAVDGGSISIEVSQTLETKLEDGSWRCVDE